MKQIDKNVNKTEDEVTDITYYVMVVGLILGFFLVIGYLISTFFE